VGTGDQLQRTLTPTEASYAFDRLVEEDPESAVRHLRRANPIAAAVDLYERYDPVIAETHPATAAHALFLSQWGDALLHSASFSPDRLKAIQLAHSNTDLAIELWKHLPDRTRHRHTVVHAYCNLACSARVQAKIEKRAMLDDFRTASRHIAEWWLVHPGRDGPEELLEKASSIYQPVFDLTANALVRLDEALSDTIIIPTTPTKGFAQISAALDEIGLLLEQSLLFRLQADLVSSRRDSLRNRRCAVLERGLRSLDVALGPRGGDTEYDRWSSDSIDRAIQDNLCTQIRPRIRRTASKLLLNLASALTEIGNNPAAGWFAAYGAELSDEADAAIDRARIEQDFSPWTAVGRLERHLSTTYPPSPRDREAARILVRLLGELGAERAAYYWETWRRNSSGNARRARPKPSSFSSARPIADKATRIAENLISTRARENAPGVIEALNGLLIRLLKIPSDGETPPIVSNSVSADLLRDAVNTVAAWDLPWRSNIEHHSPSNWNQEPLVALRFVLELSIDFAARFAQGRLPWLWQRLGDTQARLAAPIGTQYTDDGKHFGAQGAAARECYRRAAELGERYDRWVVGADAWLDVARTLAPQLDTTAVTAVKPSEVEIDEAIQAVSRARRLVRNGLNGHPDGQDRIDAVARANVHIGHIALSYLSLGDAKMAFCAADLALGVAHDGLRSEDDPARKAELIEELVLADDLDALELMRAPDAKIDEVRNRLSDIYEHQLLSRDHTLPIGRPQESRVARSGGGEVKDIQPKTVRQTLAALSPEGIATLHFMHTRRNHVYCVGAKLSADQVEYDGWDLGLPAAEASRLFSLTRDEIIPVAGREPRLLKMTGRHIFGSASTISGLTLEEWLRETPLVVVIPHGIFGGLPIHALQLPKSNQFVASQYSISYVPCFKALVHYANTSTMDVRSLPVRLFQGETEPDSQQDEEVDFDGELRTVEEILERQGWSVERPAPSTLRNCSTPAAIIHVASHGYLPSNRRAMQACVELESTEGPIRITAAEVAGAGQKARFAFWNACHVGSTVSRSGDLYGFGLALLTHVDTAILPNCPIDSKTARKVAESFYRLLKIMPEMPLAELWRCSIDTSGLIGDWAPYFVWGNPGSLVQRPVGSELGSL
jgi:hypothetical protein